MGYISETIFALISAGRIDLAIEVFEELNPEVGREELLENLIAGLLKENKRGCEEKILKLKHMLGEELTQSEADKIIAPYLRENNSHRPYYRSICPDVIAAASKESVVALLDIEMGCSSTGGEKFLRDTFAILRTKI